MISFAAILALGFVLGMRHATDPDHVVAITTIVAKQRGVGRAGLIGVFWGLGHTLTIFVLGAMIILFQLTIPPRVGLSLELAVAAMLILLGVLNLTGALGRLQEKFAPTLGLSGAASQVRLAETACNPAVDVERRPREREGRLDRLWQEMGFYNLLRPLAVGIVHGLAGSAAVAILVMTTIGNPWWSTAYLLLFGFGTVAGMMLITMVMAMPFACTGGKFSRWNRGMTLASGLLSVGFGLFLTYQIAFVEGLFTSRPQWTPQ